MPIRNESELRRQLGFRRGMDDRDLSTDGEMSLSARAGRSMPVSASRILGGTGAKGASSVSPNQVGYGKTPQATPATTEQIAKPPATLKDMLNAPPTQRRGQILPETNGAEELETQRVFREYQSQLASGQAGITGKRSLMSILRNILEGANMGLQQGGPWGAVAGAATGGFFGTMPGRQFEQMRAYRDKQAYQSKLQAQLGPQLEIAKGIDEARDKQTQRKIQAANAQTQAAQAQTYASQVADNAKRGEERLRLQAAKQKFDEDQKTWERGFRQQAEEGKNNRAAVMAGVAQGNLNLRRAGMAYDQYKDVIEGEARQHFTDAYQKIVEEGDAAAELAPPNDRANIRNTYEKRAQEAGKAAAEKRRAELLARFSANIKDDDGPAPAAAPAPKGNAPAPKSGGKRPAPGQKAGFNEVQSYFK